MFEIGFWELALLGALGLVVLGPEKLPKVAAQLGRYAGQARRMARTLTAQVREEIEAEERRIKATEVTGSTPAPASAPDAPTAASPAAAFNRPGAADLIPGGAISGSAEQAPDTATVTVPAAAATMHASAPNQTAS